MQYALLMQYAGSRQLCMIRITSNSFHWSNMIPATLKVDSSYCFLDGEQEKWLSNGKERGYMWLLLSRFSHVRLSATPWTEARQASLSITNSWSLLKLMSIKLVMPSNHLILYRPLLLPSVFPIIRILSSESVLHIRWPKFWSSSFNISPSNEYSRLICFRIDWLDLLSVPVTLKSLLQHHSSKASILWHSAFFIVQLSHLYMTIGKTMALTRWTFVGKVMALLFNMLSRLVIVFLPRTKSLLYVGLAKIFVPVFPYYLTE